MEYVYQDCDGTTYPLDKWHLHEMVDRIHCVRAMIDTLLQDHPASFLCNQHLLDAQQALGKAYQHVGNISFDMNGATK